MPTLPGMTKALLVSTALLSAFLIACGGGSSASGDDDNGGKQGTDASETQAMAASFSEEITKIRDCYQGQVDGKGDCGVTLLQDPVTRLCSGVRIGTVNPTYPNADLSKFGPTCDEWSKALGLDAAGKVALLDTMVTELETLK